MHHQQNEKHSNFQNNAEIETEISHTRKIKSHELNKKMEKKNGAFEIWICKRIGRIPRTERKPKKYM